MVKNPTKEDFKLSKDGDILYHGYKYSVYVMGLYINSLSGSLPLLNNLYKTSASQVNIMKKLSSGIKINSASDDAAGLSLSQKLTSVINGNNVAKNNTQTGVAYLNTADSALSNIGDSLQRIRDLAVQSINGVYSASERQMLQKEVTQLSSNISQTYNTTKFCDRKIFGGDTAGEYAAAINAGYNDAHIITSASDLISKITNDMSGSFILAGDIDLSSLGTLSNAAIGGIFSGTLEGNGHTISNLSIDTGSAVINGIGLFRETTGGTIKNIQLSNFNIKALNCDAIGCLAAYNGNMTNCLVSNSNIITNGGRAIGVLTGGNLTPANAITNCAAVSSSISTGNGSQYIGGLVGYQGGTISNSYSSVNITTGDGVSYIGGFVGDVNNNISSCYATGSVQVGNNASGIGGFISGAEAGHTITNCYTSASVQAGINASSIGGFTSGNGGSVGAVITNSYTTSNITVGSGAADIGGFAGYNQNNINNTNFYQNNLLYDNPSSNAIDENSQPNRPQNFWNTGVWNLSTTLPSLNNCGATLSTTLAATEGPSSLQIQAGADAQDNSRINIAINYLLGDISFDISSSMAAQLTVSKVDAKMTELNKSRGYVGASTNKLQSVLGALDNRVLNLASSKSTIYDADIANESASLIQTQIKTQACTYMLQQTKTLDGSLVINLLNTL